MARQCSVCTHEQCEEINKAILRGESYRHIATQYIGLNYRALQRHKQNGHIGRKIAITSYETKVEYGSSIFEQLDKINRDANALLDKAMTEASENPNIAIQSMREIRNQLALIMEIRQALYDIKNIQEFQEEMISALGEISPKERDKFIRKLKERQGIR